LLRHGTKSIQAVLAVDKANRKIKMNTEFNIYPFDLQPGYHTISFIRACKKNGRLIHVTSMFLHFFKPTPEADIQVDVGHKAEGALNKIAHNHESMIDI
jgi:hypothetical protein